MSAVNNAGLQLDLSVTTKITTSFLDLICTYASVLVLTSRLSDRRIIAAMYHGAHELIKGTGEPQYSDLSRFLVDFERPFVKLRSEFAPHCEVIGKALSSVKPVFDRRNLSAAMLRKNNTLSVSHNSAMMREPTTDGVQVDLLSLGDMVRWVCFGYLMLPDELVLKPDAQAMLLVALNDGFLLRLYRDESINIHAEYDTVLGAIKEAKVLYKSVIEAGAQTAASAGVFHDERRRYAKQSLRTLFLLFSDKPGLLGPKVSVALAALQLSRDEVRWLFRHRNSPEKVKYKTKPEDYADSELAELLYWTFELRNLVLQHKDLIQRYHAEFLGGHDLATLRSLLQPMILGEREQHIVAACAQTMGELPSTIGSPSDLSGFRRVQLVR